MNARTAEARPEGAREKLKERYRVNVVGTLLTLEPRSVMPGRERWRFVAEPDARPLDIARQLISQLPGIRAVTVNPRIGSVLLEFDPALAAGGSPLLLQMLTNATQVIFAAPLEAPQQVVRRTDCDKEKCPIPPGIGLIGAGLIAGAMALPASYVAGAAVLAVSAGILWHYWEKSLSLRRKGSATGAHAHSIRRLLQLHPELKKDLVLASACSVGGKVLNTVPPIALGFTLGILTGGPVGVLCALGLFTQTSQLLFVVGVGVVLWCYEAYLEYEAGTLWRKVAQIAQDELRTRGYRHVQLLEFGVLENERVGRLASVLTEDVSQLQQFLETGAHDLLQLGTNLALIAPLFYLVAPSVAWIAVLPIPLLMWISFRYVEQTAPLFAQVRRKAGMVSSQLVTNLDGIGVIRSFATEEFEANRIEGLSAAFRESSQQTAERAASFSPTIRMTMLLTWAGALLVGGLQVINGTITAGAYATMVPLARGFLWPIVILGKTVDDYQRAVAAADRVFELIDIPVRSTGPCLPLVPSRVRGEITIENLGFNYPARPAVFTELAMCFKPGTITGIVGSTGSGKTTIVKLLLRFYDVSSGRILLDGRDIREYDVYDLRRCIGLVSQDVFLFEGTIRDNIAYGSFDAPEEIIVEAARLAELQSFIASLPEGYATIVGERGVKLSGGQRQRICLARAILKDPPVLILDEATSSIDTETEAAIQRALEKVCVGRTTISVAHRLSTIRHAERIYVLNGGGTVEEAGTHYELLRRGGLYASMWKIQSGLAGRHSQDIALEA